jgi:hypothetical protein
VGGACDPYFQQVLPVKGRELRVYRCSWGWYVKSAARGVRSRYLDEALEGVIGTPPDRETLLAMIETLDRELTAERDRTGQTAVRIFEP